jgi:hypothetical protein
MKLWSYEIAYVPKSFFVLKQYIKGCFHGMVYSLCVETKGPKDTKNAQLYEKWLWDLGIIMSIHVNLWLDVGL